MGGGLTLKKEVEVIRDRKVATDRFRSAVRTVKSSVLRTGFEKTIS